MKDSDWKNTLATAFLIFVFVASLGSCSYMESKMEIERLKIEKGIK